MGSCQSISRNEVNNCEKRPELKLVSEHISKAIPKDITRNAISETAAKCGQTSIAQSIDLNNLKLSQAESEARGIDSEKSLEPSRKGRSVKRPFALESPESSTILKRRAMPN